MKYLKNAGNSFPINNYFNLPNAENLHCYIKSYSPSLSNLTIVITNSKLDTLRVYYEVYFTATSHINLPTSWKNASFQLATPERCLAFLRAFEDFDKYEDDSLLRLHRMFVVQLKSAELIIIAGDGSIITGEQLQKLGKKADDT